MCFILRCRNAKKAKQYQRNTTPLSEGSVDSVDTTETFIFSQEPVNGESGEVTGQKATDVRWPFFESGAKFEEAISECSKADQEHRQQPGTKEIESWRETMEVSEHDASKNNKLVKSRRAESARRKDLDRPGSCEVLVCER